MKKGKLILGNKIHHILYDQTPSMNLEVQEIGNGLNKVTSYGWLPLKLSENLNYKSDNGVFLIPEESNDIYTFNHVDICEGVMNFKRFLVH